MKKPKRQPSNPAGRHGKPIILPETTFEDAIKKVLATPPPPKEAKKKSASKKRATS
jgi:hypothetical protein